MENNKNIKSQKTIKQYFLAILAIITKFIKPELSARIALRKAILILKKTVITEYKLKIFSSPENSNDRMVRKRRVRQRQVL